MFLFFIIISFLNLAVGNEKEPSGSMEQ